MPGQFSKMGCLIYALFSAAFAASLLADVKGAKKTWISNTNFGSPTNWDAGRIPCSKDRVIIPQKADVSLFLQQLVQVREMVLPRNGELILPVNGELDVGIVKPSDSCDGQDVTFVAINSRAWYDPANWQVAKSAGFLTTSVAATQVPHSERIPCPSDHVVFPANSSFSVHVDSAAAIHVGTFEINEKVPIEVRVALRATSQKFSYSLFFFFRRALTLDPAGLRDFLASPSGLRQFRVDGSLTTGRMCSDLAGCSCGNDEPQVLKRICVHATLFGCPVPQCVDPITPAGFCCAICGSTVTVTVDEYFQFDRLKSSYMYYLQKPEFVTVSGYAFKTFNGQVQAVFVDDSRFHRSDRLADAIVENVLSKKFQQARLNVVSFSAETTTDWSHAAAAHLSTGMSTGGWVAIIFGLLSAAIIGFLYFVQKSHLLPLPFSFGRFENEWDRDGGRGFEIGVELEPRNLAAATAASIALVKADEIKGFDNPYYDDTCKDGTKTSQIGKSYETQHTRQNPCYMPYDRVEDIPEASEEGS